MVSLTGPLPIAASSPLGIAGGIGLDVAGKAIDFGFGQLAAKAQARQAKEMYRKRWRWSLGDMRKAGVNPILATKAGPGAAPSVALGSTGGPVQMGATSARLAQTNLAGQQAETQRVTRAEIAGRTRAPGMQDRLDRSAELVNSAHSEQLRAAGKSALSQANLNDELALLRAAERIGIPEERRLRRAIAEAMGTGFDALNQEMHEAFGSDWLKWIIAASMVMPAGRLAVWGARAVTTLGLSGKARTLFMQALKFTERQMKRESSLQRRMRLQGEAARGKLPFMMRGNWK